MPKYTIRVQINLEADDMEFDSEADAEAFGWEMAHKAHQYYVSVEDIEVDEIWEDEEE
jgi:hypothetical protein